MKAEMMMQKNRHLMRKQGMTEEQINLQIAIQEERDQWKVYVHITYDAQSTK